MRLHEQYSHIEKKLIVEILWFNSVEVVYVGKGLNCTPQMRNLTIFKTEYEPLLKGETMRTNWQQSVSRFKSPQHLEDEIEQYLQSTKLPTVIGLQEHTSISKATYYHYKRLPLYTDVVDKFEDIVFLAKIETTMKSKEVSPQLLASIEDEIKMRRIA